MNEWKELEIDNLPNDILTGGYELEWLDNFGDSTGKWYASDFGDRNYMWKIIHALIDGREYRYRKPDPKAPSHEEIKNRHLNRIQEATRIYGIESIFLVEALSDTVQYLLTYQSDTPPEVIS